MSKTMHAFPQIAVKKGRMKTTSKTGISTYTFKCAHIIFAA